MLFLTGRFLRVTLNKQQSLAIFALLSSAFFWGITWYPYRIMAESGVSAIVSSFYTYVIILTIACVVFVKHWRGLFNLPKNIIWLSLAAGWTNFSYVIAVVDGEVMRVILLFYLAPVWTLILSHFWLHEKTSKTGYIAIAVSLMGAYVMLSNPLSGKLSFPVPKNQSDWLALSAGMGFAVANVMTRKAQHLSLPAKSFAVWVGVIMIVLISTPFLKQGLPAPQLFTSKQWMIMLLLAAVLMAATVLTQYGVTKVAATRASVLFLLELIVAAIGSYYLANEVMSLSEWVGGALILAAAVFAALNHHNEH